MAPSVPPLDQMVRRMFLLFWRVRCLEQGFAMTVTEIVAVDRVGIEQDLPALFTDDVFAFIHADSFQCAIGGFLASVLPAIPLYAGRARTMINYQTPFTPLLAFDWAFLIPSVDRPRDNKRVPSVTWRGMKAIRMTATMTSTTPMIFVIFIYVYYLIISTSAWRKLVGVS